MVSFFNIFRIICFQFPNKLGILVLTIVSPDMQRLTMTGWLLPIDKYSTSRIAEDRRAASRGNHIPSEYSTMSVASRIRRMPVPENNRDVDRFLDEVFEQVCSI